MLVVTLDRPAKRPWGHQQSCMGVRPVAAGSVAARWDPDRAGDRFFSLLGPKGRHVREGDRGGHGPGGFAGITDSSTSGPPVAAVNGPALGAVSNWPRRGPVVAADHAEFAFTEVTLGLVADAGGLLRLPARLPRAIAVEYLLTGRRIPAAEAARWGLVNRVVPAAELMTAARGLADAICSAAPLAIAAALEILRETEGADVRTGYRFGSGNCLCFAGCWAPATPGKALGVRAPRAAVGGGE